MLTMGESRDMSRIYLVLQGMQFHTKMTLPVFRTHQVQDFWLTQSGISMHAWKSSIYTGVCRVIHGPGISNAPLPHIPISLRPPLTEPHNLV